MKIVLANYRYFLSGGPERYLFSIQRMLQENYVEVTPFSVKSKYNVTTRWEEHFMTPVSGDNTVYFDDYQMDLRTIIKILERNIYSPEGFIKAKRLAEAVSPDVVYLLQFLNKMSPSVIDGFKCAGRPVVVRLSDFGLICPQGLLLRNGRNCEDCVTRSLINCIRFRCVKNSTVGSLIKILGRTVNRLVGSIARVDAFVCPSQFTKRKFEEAGFAREKLNCIPTFIDVTKIEPDYNKGEYVLYFGRAREEKGVHVLLKAYELLGKRKPSLVVIGDFDSSEYGRSLKAMYSEGVTFVDFLGEKELFEYIKKSLFIVVPSICYDNMPNVVLEAFAHGKAVVASDNGGFPALIKDGMTGMLFETGNPEALANKLAWAVSHETEVVEMGKQAREYVEESHSPEEHFRRLMALFRRISRE